MNLNRIQLEWLADTAATTLAKHGAWPTPLHLLADAIEKDCPNFNKDKWIKRALKAWEDNYIRPEINDEIPY